MFVESDVGELTAETGIILFSTFDPFCPAPLWIGYGRSNAENGNMFFQILLLIATLDFHLGFGINALLQSLCGFFPSSINEETLAKHAENAKGSGFAGTGVNGGGTFLCATPGGGSPNNHGNRMGRRSTPANTSKLGLTP